MKNAWTGTVLRTLFPACLLLSSSCAQVLESDEETLRFQSTEANVRNYFLRQGPVATHVLTTSGSAPRIVWAFPSENTGMGIWFHPPALPTQITVEEELEPMVFPNGLWGVSATITSDAPQLRVKKAVFGNVRSVRDYFYGATIIPEFQPSVEAGPPMILDAPTVDGKHDLRLVIDFRAGTTGKAEGDSVVFRAGKNGKIHLHTFALINYKPLTPFAKDELLLPGIVP
ncbi:MAG TPA: hypothetical protein VE782_02065, partial [Myxococcaceae bacterium]|nr:hypothetical protein [Myxococcaceae bacterium]